MKISDVLNSNSSANVSGMPAKEEKRISGTGNAVFRSQLQQVEGKNIEQRMNELAARIFEQGEKLEKKTDIMELKKYKKLVSEFLDEAVKNSHKFFKRNFLDRRGRYKGYAIVKKINEELERLTEDVLRAEKDKIGILQRLDGIKGLILDLMI